MTRTALSPRQIGMLLAVLAAFGFSFKAILVKLAYLAGPVDAITLLSLRMLFSLPMFLLSGFAYLRNGPRLNRKDWALLIFLGLTGYYGASILDFAGLQYISAGLERVILFTYPTITILIGLLFLGKTASPRLIGALVLCYAGVSLVFVSDHQFAEDSIAPWLGAALVFGSALSYACYTAFAEVSIAKLGAARFSILALIVSILAAQLHFLVTNPISDLIQPLPIYAYCAAMALFSTVLPIFFQSGAIQRIGAGPTVLVGMLGPVMTIVFSWLLLAEPLTWIQLAGTALVIWGIYLIRRQ
ncbi:DMT family transporter [Halopseudomonas sp.]|uniref:DMT family transporter n=1 Tax=Halopseudomonas sp. TaxID=2901191 RepID=UPI00311EFD66